MPVRQRLQRSVQRRNRVEEQRRIDPGRPQHLDEMAEEAKPGDIGAGARTRFADATRRLAAGLLHHRKRPVDPGTLRLPAHLGSKQCSGTQRLGEDQAIAHAHPGLPQHAIWIDRAVDGESQRQLGAFAAVSADQDCARLLQHIEAAAQHLVELLLDLVLRPVGDGCGRQCGQRLGAHRVDVAQRMIGGNAAEEVWVVYECAKEIDGLHEQLALRRRYHRGIVGRAEADLHARIAARL